jgi:hypothetical protein
VRDNQFVIEDGSVDIAFAGEVLHEIENKRAFLKG